MFMHSYLKIQTVLFRITTLQFSQLRRSLVKKGQNVFDKTVLQPFFHAGVDS